MLTPGVSAPSTSSALAVASGRMPSPPPTASLMVRELMPEPYWRVRLVVGGVACAAAAWVPAAWVPAASPPLSRRSRAVWTAWAGEVSREVSRGFGSRQGRRGSGGESPRLSESQGYMSYTGVLLIEIRGPAYSQPA